MELIPVYARKERALDCPDTVKFDVVIYKDEARTKLFARFPWHFESKPDKRHKRVTINCYSWRLVWID